MILVDTSAWVEYLRGNGDPVRSLMDCVIAAVALRDGMSVLARDRDPLPPVIMGSQPDSPY